MAVFTLRLVSDGSWAAIRENGQISPGSQYDELRVVFTGPIAMENCLIKIINGQKNRAPIPCPIGASVISLGKVFDFVNGRFQICIGDDQRISLTANYQFCAPWGFARNGGAAPAEEREAKTYTKGLSPASQEEKGRNSVHSDETRKLRKECLELQQRNPCVKVLCGD